MPSIEYSVLYSGLVGTCGKVEGKRHQELWIWNVWIVGMNNSWPKERVIIWLGHATKDRGTGWPSGAKETNTKDMMESLPDMN